MIAFDQHPTYSPYRTLHLTTPHQSGQDVYALQTALLAAGIALPQFGADGDLGRETANGVVAWQRKAGLAVDGLAGGTTQKSLALHIAQPLTGRYGLPDGLLRGQVEHESSFRLGNYSQVYANGTYDAGVAQRNTGETSARDGFTVGPSIEALAARVRRYHGFFEGVAEPLRRWQLAQACWNAPAWACWLAKREGATAVPASELPRAAPTAAQVAQLQTYIVSVSAYVQL